LRLNRTYVVAAHDVLVAAGAFVLGLLLRRGSGNFWLESGSFLVEGLLLFTAIAAIVFWRTRIYRSLWRYVSLRDVIELVKAAGLVILIFLPALFAITRLEAFPRSSLIIIWILLLLFLIGPRVAYRAFVERSVSGLLERTEGGRVPVLLAGAGAAADEFIRSTTSGASTGYRVVGLLDDDPKKRGLHIRGVRVFGQLDNLPDALRKLRRRGLRPQRLILADERLAPERVRALLEAADGFGLSFARLPRLTDFRTGQTQAFELKPIAIEDLLGRPQTVLDRAGMRALIQGKRVCVTGAGGTIGAELVRQIAAYGPARLVLIDNAEFNLYAIDAELQASFSALPRAALIADVRERARLDAIFARERPDLVFHAAALKHVPIVEDNPNEGVLTNVIGTKNVADACVEAGVGAMVLISTDKAVDPTSVMGATKRIAESYCQARGADRAARRRTHFITVRFGNVLGSSGSVVPLFQRQIAAGGPVTVTHPEVSRYFMTTREAVELVLQASALGAREEEPSIFVLDMGTPIKIADLARQMIRLAGRQPERDIAIQFTGLRPGEKLHEALFHDGERRGDAGLAGLHRAFSRPLDPLLIARQVDELGGAARAGLTPRTLALIAALVPEYHADETTRQAAT
jgi:O-antigen biosynthesis protein WbqV